MNKRLKIILYTFLILGSLYFLFFGLSKGKGFLIPITTAIILSMVMNPVAKKFIQWGVARGWAIFFADLVVVLFIAFMIFLLVAQANQVANNWSQIQSKMQPKIEQVQRFFSEKLNMSVPGLPGQGGQSRNQSGQDGGSNQDGSQEQNSGQAQNQEAGDQAGGQSGQQEQQQGGGSQSQSGQASGMQGLLTSIVQNIFGFFGDMLLILVYIFFFLFYQKKFEDAVLGLAPDDRREKTKSILNESAKTAQQYLFGRFMLIFILAVLYVAGYSAIGLQYAIFISLLAALFSLIPYVGNVMGLVLAVLASFVGDGGAGQIIAIAVIFSVIQFVESYVLEPFIVGGKVDLNPVVVIVGVVLGGIVWGIMGMILAIPVLGILKVVFDNINELKPLGYVLDERGIPSGDGWPEKVKSWVLKKIKK